MIRNFEKNMHILNQVMGYFKKSGAMEIDTKIIFKNDYVYITVSSIIEGICDKTIRDLEKQIGIPRQEEIEENYWNIGLNCNPGDEMALVGMMTDRCEVTYDNSILTIMVERQC